MEVTIIETGMTSIHRFNVKTDAYSISASANVEEGKVVSVQGDVTVTATETQFINFSGNLDHTGKLTVNYHNIPADERDALDVISATVDAAILKYQGNE